MIEISKLTKDDIGKWVLFTPKYDKSNGELGKIKSWNRTFIYVVYNCAYDWNNFKNYTSIPTDPDMLVFSKAEPMTKEEILYEGRDYDSSVKEVNGIE